MVSSEAVRPTVGLSRPQPGPASEVRPEADARLLRRVGVSLRPLASRKCLVGLRLAVSRRPPGYLNRLVRVGGL